MYDFTFKIVLIGEESNGKTILKENYLNRIFDPDYRLTIGVDFHVKALNMFGRFIKLQIWDMGGGEKFRFLRACYCKGANGAIAIYNRANSDALKKIVEDIRIIRESAGNIPFILVASTVGSEEQAINRDEEISIVEDYSLSAFTELNVENGQGIEQVFETLGEFLIGRLGGNLRKLIDTSSRRNWPEFVINEYLKLRLEFGRTNIYVNGRLFNQCKYLLLNIPIKEIDQYQYIDSIDEAVDRLDSSLEGGVSNPYITPETEFWGHCSNIQAWYENGYDTRILHRNLAFPLLHELVKVGDPLAKKVYKEEIALRLESGYPSVIQYLVLGGYLKYFKEEELSFLLDNQDLMEFITKVPHYSNFTPKWLSDKLRLSSRKYRRLFRKS
ncbi:MAG: GTP-binding protein [Promethearchaeota archaeon]